MKQVQQTINFLQRLCGEPHLKMLQMSSKECSICTITCTADCSQGAIAFGTAIDRADYSFAFVLSRRPLYDHTIVSNLIIAHSHRSFSDPAIRQQVHTGRSSPRWVKAAYSFGVTCMTANGDKKHKGSLGPIDRSARSTKEHAALASCSGTSFRLRSELGGELKTRPWPVRPLSLHRAWVC